MPQLNIDQPDKQELLKRYLDLGWIVTPVRADDPKAPKYTDWPDRDPATDLNEYEYGIFLACGQRSGVSVIDLDFDLRTDPRADDWAALIRKFPTPYARTPSGGAHIFVAYSDADWWGNQVDFTEDLDLRNDRGGVVLPSGDLVRTWAVGHSPVDIPLGDPEPYEALLIEQRAKPIVSGKSRLADILRDPPSGTRGRNDWLFAVASHLSAKIPYEDAFVEMLYMANSTLDNPLPESEIDHTVAVVWQRDRERQEERIDERLDWRIDWAELWDFEDKTDWLVEPLVITGGRTTHIYSDRGEGKSTLSLYLAAALATGKPVLDRPESEPMTVAYVDMEMTKGDLKHNLREFGYDRSHDLSRLRYALSPPWSKLEVPESALNFLAWLDEDKPDLLIVDSITRTIVGSEQDASTFHLLYDSAIGPVKYRGISSIWLGNTGKDKSRGSRGSMAKEDVLDLIWRLERDKDSDKRMTLHLTKDRQGMAPASEFDLLRNESDDGTISYKPETQSVGLNAASRKIVELLDSLGADDLISRRKAKDLLAANGHGARATSLGDAVNYRKWRSKTGVSKKTPNKDAGTAAGTILSDGDGNRPGTINYA